MRKILRNRKNEMKSYSVESVSRGSKCDKTKLCITIYIHDNFMGLNQSQAYTYHSNLFLIIFCSKIIKESHLLSRDSLTFSMRNMGDPVYYNEIRFITTKMYLSRLSEGQFIRLTL